MKKGLVSFALLGLVINFQNSSGSVVETNINTKVNETETSVKVNQPGEVEVKVKDGKVEIKTSKGITPTIIITGIPTQNIKIEEKVNQVNQEENKIFPRIYDFIRGFFKRLFGIFLPTS